MFNKKMFTMTIMLLLVFGLSLGVAAEEFSMTEPFLLTSIGQSPDVDMAASLSNRAELDFEFDALAEAEKLEEVESLILVVGGSSKGLGDAGIDSDVEIERAEALIETAREKEMPIVGMHLGGQARRGDLSDSLIEAVFPEVDYYIVVEEGDHDEMFSNIAEEYEVAGEFVDATAMAQQPLVDLFE